MSLTDQGEGSNLTVQPNRQKKKKQEIDRQALAERILRLLKKEARLDRERQGPR